MITIKNNMFHLATENTSYIFYINESGIAEHLYYGKRLKNPEYDIDALMLTKIFQTQNLETFIIYFPIFTSILGDYTNF